MTLTVEQAEDLAQRTLAAIDAVDLGYEPPYAPAADRERVASDLAGLRRYWLHTRFIVHYIVTPYAQACSDGLLRTAKLYGVEP